ncbi:helix-turn-helix domain-containing protein [Salmonella enterica]|nr:helix-turn-helix domain-containing protein [Salmonella enterica]
MIGSGAQRRQVAIIYDVGLSTLYRKFQANKSGSFRCSN